MNDGWAENEAVKTKMEYMTRFRNFIFENINLRLCGAIDNEYELLVRMLKIL